VLARIAAETKQSPLKIMRDFAGLAFGPGRVSFHEYVKLRLFDDAYYPHKRAVIGWTPNDRINKKVNFLHEWWGLVANKIGHAGYLAAHGFPTIPPLMVYADNAVGHGPKVARDANELQAFLRSSDLYPMFGKPVEGFQSLGSIALKRFDSGTQSLETVDGRSIPITEFVENVVASYPHGYLFQEFMTPHPAARAICGNRVATVRILTIIVDGTPKVFRACWKIPAGSNMADNFWRAGNMLAQLDTASGRVMRAFSGTGLDLIEHTHHPETGAALADAEVPLWSELVATALQAARLMRDVPMIGWDMAALEHGPMIVEMNCTPDLFLNQISDKRGILEPEFLNFIEQQKRQRKAVVRDIRARMNAAAA
jgi:hypothetical protein